ncbi:MAG: hypothetical protein WC326_16245 [Candidatus Delongbacteria bacterium]
MKAGDKPQEGTETSGGGQGAPAQFTQQRAATVIKRLKIPATVAAGVLAEHGLTRTALVDPVEFEALVTAWLAAPAQKQ